MAVATRPRRAPGRRTSYSCSEASRRRLLDAGIRVFADRGYRRGTLRAVCRKAGANGAAANYHFGSKQGLYRAVLEEAFTRVQRAAPIDTEAPPPRDAAEARVRLRETVTRLTSSLLAPRPPAHSLLLLREMVEPSPALDAVVERFVRPRFRALRATVHALAPWADEAEATWATLCLFGQIAYHRTAGPVALRLLGVPAYDSSLVREVAERVSSFTERALAARHPGAGDR